MNRLQRATVLTALIDALHRHGSWCGETHIQKSTYFLQALSGIPTGFIFILYKHGPFSFDLRDELSAMRADGLLKLNPRVPPYGPSIGTTVEAERLRERFAKTLNRHEKQIEFIAQQLGNKGVGELERFATALYVTKRGNADKPLPERPQELCTLKPHVSIEEASAAIQKIDAMIKEVGKP